MESSPRKVDLEFLELAEPTTYGKAYIFSEDFMTAELQVAKSYQRVTDLKNGKGRFASPWAAENKHFPMTSLYGGDFQGRQNEAPPTTSVMSQTFLHRKKLRARPPKGAEEEAVEPHGAVATPDPVQPEPEQAAPRSESVPLEKSVYTYKGLSKAPTTDPVLQKGMPVPHPSPSPLLFASARQRQNALLKFWEMERVEQVKEKMVQAGYAVTPEPAPVTHKGLASNTSEYGAEGLPELAEDAHPSGGPYADGDAMSEGLDGIKPPSEAVRDEKSQSLKQMVQKLHKDMPEVEVPVRQNRTTTTSKDNPLLARPFVPMNVYRPELPGGALPAKLKPIANKLRQRAEGGDGEHSERPGSAQSIAVSASSFVMPAPMTSIQEEYLRQKAETRRVTVTKQSIDKELRAVRDTGLLRKRRDPANRLKVGKDGMVIRNNKVMFLPMKPAPTLPKSTL